MRLMSYFGTDSCRSERKQRKLCDGPEPFIANCLILDEGMGLLADMMRRPLFEPQRVELARRHMLEGIRREADSSSVVGEKDIGIRTLSGTRLRGDAHIGVR